MSHKPRERSSYCQDIFAEYACNFSQYRDAVHQALCKLTLLSQAIHHKVIRYVISKEAVIVKGTFMIDSLRRTTRERFAATRPSHQRL
jgi:hypothetical protein